MGLSSYQFRNELSGAGAVGQAGVPVSQIPLVSGAELYAEPSVTGLNTQPVDDHSSLALLGVNLSGPARVDLEALCVKLLSEGSVALVRGDLVAAGASPVDIQASEASHDGEHGRAVVHAGSTTQGHYLTGGAPALPFVLLDDLVTLDPALPFTASNFAQRFWAKVDGESKCVTRLFSKTTGDDARATREWRVRDYTGFGSEEQKHIATAHAPGDAVVAYPNGLGILYKSQRTYRRLEAIFATIERMQSGVNSKTIISGYVGSVEQAHSELRRADRDVALFPTGATVHRVASSSAIDQLMREFETLLPLYLRRLHFVHFEADGQLSGVSRRLAMAPLLAFVEKLRGQLAEVCALCGARLMFDPEPWQRVIGKRSE